MIDLLEQPSPEQPQSNERPIPIPISTVFYFHVSFPSSPDTFVLGATSGNVAIPFSISNDRKKLSVDERSLNAASKNRSLLPIASPPAQPFFLLDPRDEPEWQKVDKNLAQYLPYLREAYQQNLTLGVCHPDVNMFISDELRKQYKIVSYLEPLIFHLGENPIRKKSLLSFLRIRYLGDHRDLAELLAVAAFTRATWYNQDLGELKLANDIFPVPGEKLINAVKELSDALANEQGILRKPYVLTHQLSYLAQAVGPIGWRKGIFKSPEGVTF